MLIYPTPIPISLQPMGGRLRPRLAARQEDGGVHVITQTVRRPSTTYVTYVTLGPGEPTPILGGDPVQAPPEPTPTAAPPPPSRGDGSLSSVQVGAILGGIVAFVAIVLIACYCTMSSRRRRPPPDTWCDYGYDYFPVTCEPPPVKPPPRAFFPVFHGQQPHRPPRVRVPRPREPAPPPRPSFHINQHPPWNPTYSGPRRTARPGRDVDPPVKSSKPLRRYKVHGPPRTERSQSFRVNEAAWTGRTFG